jgi:hypothetical protein
MSRFIKAEMSQPYFIAGIVFAVLLIGASLVGIAYSLATGVYATFSGCNIVFVDCTSSFIESASIILLLSGVSIAGTLFLAAVGQAIMDLLKKECEDYHAFIADKGLEHDYKKYCIDHGIAYDEELNSWRSEFPEANIKFVRRIKLP